jgi:hypothetical protein
MFAADAAWALRMPGRVPVKAKVAAAPVTVRNLRLVATAAARPAWVELIKSDEIDT